MSSADSVKQELAGGEQIDLYSYCTWTNFFIFYVVFHLLTYAFFFFMNRKVYSMDRSLEEKYYPWARHDYQHHSLIKTFPLWLTLWPRAFVLFTCKVLSRLNLLGIICYTIWILLVMIGYRRGDKIGALRRKLVVIPG